MTDLEKIRVELDFLRRIERDIGYYASLPFEERIPAMIKELENDLKIEFWAQRGIDKSKEM